MSFRQLGVNKFICYLASRTIKQRFVEGLVTAIRYPHVSKAQLGGIWLNSPLKELCVDAGRTLQEF